MCQNTSFLEQSLTGREVRTLFPMVVHTGKLLSPLHHLFLSFCHVISLLYETKNLPPAVWATQGKVHCIQPSSSLRCVRQVVRAPCMRTR